jgi:hypothetical protein
MIFPLFLPAALCLPLAGFDTQLVEQTCLFKHASSFKPNEFQALNIKLDDGDSPESYRLSRGEKIALKLTQITLTIN